MNRFLGGLTKSVRKPWQIYPIGLLFGLGFDTATEVGLLVLAGGAAAFQLPWYAILTLPVLFAAGMSLLDSIDGVFMNYAYGWAFSRPVRKVYYNITITALSVAVALIIGTIELVSILDRQARDHPRAAGLGRRPGPEPRRLRDRRPVRADLGGRAHRVAGRPYRGALVRRAVGRDRLTSGRVLLGRGLGQPQQERELLADLSVPALDPVPITGCCASELQVHHGLRLGLVEPEPLAESGLRRVRVVRLQQHVEGMLPPWQIEGQSVRSSRIPAS